MPLEPIGLFGFAWVSLGPSFGIPWIAPLLFTVLIGIANFAIYMATIDYMIAAYGPFSASATGGNGFCRDFLAGIAALWTKPFYTRIARGTRYQLVIPTLILSGIAALLAVPVYVFYVWGEFFRARSPFAQSLEQKRGLAAHAPPKNASLSTSGESGKTHVSGRIASKTVSRANSLNLKRDRNGAGDPEKTGLDGSSDASATGVPCRTTNKGMGSDGRLGASRALDSLGREVVAAPVDVDEITVAPRQAQRLL